MDLIEKSIIIHIDSHERLSGEHQDGLYDLTPQLQNGRLEEFDRCVMLACTVPKSYYAVEKNYNFFYVKETEPSEFIETDPSGFVKIEIPIGTYSANQFKDELKSQLNNNLQYTYNIELSLTSAKFKYIVSNNATQPIFKTTVNLYENLGFEPNKEYTFDNNELTSTTVIDMSPENDIRIRSNLVQSSNNNSDILQDLQGSGVPPFSRIQFYQHDFLGYSKNINTSSNVIRIYITNEDENEDLSRILDLNNKNWNATILLYKKNNISSIIKNSIKLMINKFFS